MPVFVIPHYYEYDIHFDQRVLPCIVVSGHPACNAYLGKGSDTQNQRYPFNTTEAVNDNVTVNCIDTVHNICQVSVIITYFS